MNPETIAAILAAVVAIGAGLRKAKGLIRDDGAINTVVEMLRQEVKRLSDINTQLHTANDSVLKENAALRIALERRDRDHHECQMALNRVTFQLESFSNDNPEYPKRAAND